jgi:hypothetical protein
MVERVEEVVDEVVEKVVEDNATTAWTHKQIWKNKKRHFKHYDMHTFLSVYYYAK